MKKLFFLAAMAVLVLSCGKTTTTEETDTTTAENFNYNKLVECDGMTFHGDIKAIRVNGRLTEDLCNFSQEGKLLDRTKKIWVSDNSYGTILTTYEYDEQGHLICMVDDNQMDNQIETHTYTYEGDLLVSDVMKSDKSTSVSTYTYNEQGQRVQETFVRKDEEGVVDWETVITYTYDEEGRKATSSFSNYSIEGNTQYVYNEKGLLIREDARDNMFDEVMQTVYTYDEHDNPVSIKVTGDDNMVYESFTYEIEMW